MSSDIPAFKVSLSQNAKGQMSDLLRKAERLQIGESARRALERAASALARDPQTFGDPLYPIRHRNGSVRRGISPPFAFHFALYPDDGVVFVFSIQAMPMSPLDVN